MLALIIVTVAATQVAPPLAQKPMDVVKEAVRSGGTLGGLGFGVTAVAETISRSGVSGQARTRVPYFIFQAALLNGQRLARVAAGFAGGRAAGQLYRGADDGVVSLIAACTAGAFSAATLAQVPSSMMTFACFTYFIDSMTGAYKKDGAAAAVDAPPPRPGLSPGQRLDKLLGTTPTAYLSEPQLGSI